MSEMPGEETDGSADWTGSGDMLLVYKKQFIQFGIFIAFLVVLFAVTAVFAALSSSAVRRGLGDSVRAALDSNGYEDVMLEAPCEIQGPLSVTASAYTVSGSGYSYAVILRITTMAGPVPAVFLYDGTSAKADFLCYLSLSKRVERMLLDSTRHSLIEYWAVRLPEMLSVPKEEVSQ
ncbi:MAG: hypothetical protein IJR93_06410 [Treponema sp.]|nr:hypothetical protein [Treponema sp.]